MKGKIIPRGLKREQKARSGERTAHKPHWFQAAQVELGVLVNPDGPKAQMPVTPRCVLGSKR